MDAKGIHNYDLPSSIDRNHFYDDMMRLTGGVSIEKLEYNFNNPAWKPEMVIVKPAPVIIMEGLRLKEVPEGTYFMVALTIRLMEKEAAPERVILMEGIQA